MQDISAIYSTIATWAAAHHDFLVVAFVVVLLAYVDHCDKAGKTSGFLYFIAKQALRMVPQRKVSDTLPSAEDIVRENERLRAANERLSGENADLRSRLGGSPYRELPGSHDRPPAPVLLPVGDVARPAVTP